MGTYESKSGRPARNGDKPFTEIFRQLIQGETQQTAADKIGVSRQNIGKWLSGSTTPDIETLCRIADAYNVSTDYLLGRTPNKTFDTELKAVCEYTGLSEKSIGKIIKLKEEPQCLKMLNCLVEIGFIEYLAIILRKIQLSKRIIVRHENFALENLNKGKSPSAEEKTEVIYHKLAVANDRNELTEVMLGVIDSITGYSYINDEIRKEFIDTFRKRQTADIVKVKLLGTEILTDDEHEKLIQILFEGNDKKDGENNGKHTPS